MTDDGLGKKAEDKLKLWLDRPDLGYSFYRIKDQMTGFYGSKNPCDFIVYKSPSICYLESKATWKDRFDFSMVTDNQRIELVTRSSVAGVHGILAVLFAGHQRMFLMRASDLFSVDGHSGEAVLKDDNVKSLNIKKLGQWTIPYVEVSTIPSRKQLLEYDGDFFEYVDRIR